MSAVSPASWSARTTEPSASALRTATPTSPSPCVTPPVADEGPWPPSTSPDGSGQTTVVQGTLGMRRGCLRCCSRLVRSRGLSSFSGPCSCTARPRSLSRSALRAQPDWSWCTALSGGGRPSQGVGRPPLAFSDRLPQRDAAVSNRELSVVALSPDALPRVPQRILVRGRCGPGCVSAAAAVTAGSWTSHQPGSPRSSSVPAASAASDATGTPTNGTLLMPSLTASADHHHTGTAAPGFVDRDSRPAGLGARASSSRPPVRPRRFALHADDKVPGFFRWGG